MNQYGYMALMDDYTFLEEVGRKVSEAGREIVQGGFQQNVVAQRGGGRGRGRGRGRGGGNGKSVQQRNGGGNTSKRDTLRMELDFRDIEMDMLPVGMEKRTLNQSTWDPTCVRSTCILTHPHRVPIMPIGIQHEHCPHDRRVRLPPSAGPVCTFVASTQPAVHSRHAPKQTR